MTLTVAVGGLGAIGMSVVRALAEGIDGLSLAAISAQNVDGAARRLKALCVTVPILKPEDLAGFADIVVECLPPALFDRIARPAIEVGRILIAASAGQLLAHPDLIEIAKRRGARIIVPSGALAGLDGVRACAEAVVRSVRLITRKPPHSLSSAPLVVRNKILLAALDSPLKLFDGNAAAAIDQFPANVNVAVTLALAGIGPERTMVEIWADPGVERNVHRIEIDSDVGRISITVEGAPSLDNPATSRLAGASVIATLRKLTTSLAIGT